MVQEPDDPTTREIEVARGHQPDREWVVTATLQGSGPPRLRLSSPHDEFPAQVMSEELDGGHLAAECGTVPALAGPHTGRRIGRRVIFGLTDATIEEVRFVGNEQNGDELTVACETVTLDPRRDVRAFALTAGTVNSSGQLLAVRSNDEIAAQLDIHQTRVPLPTVEDGMRQLQAELESAPPQYELLGEGTHASGRWRMEGGIDQGRVTLSLSPAEGAGGPLMLEAPVLASHEYLGKPTGHGWPLAPTGQPADYHAWIGQVSKAVTQVVARSDDEVQQAIVLRSPGLPVDAFIVFSAANQPPAAIVARDESGEDLQIAPLPAPSDRP